ncbi:MAG: AAA family ATPase [Janthinobacterium lividum]
MRITRLELERYGHVSGETLDFPAAAGLHVVVGANEAGKSTALEAVADGLFGFSRKHSRKLNHPDDPRIGLTLRAADGTEARFVRRKAGRDKLFDTAGQPLPETALARFLGGVSRERFAEVFGLDGERLRQAGRTLMAEHGEAGAAVLQAQTGLHGLREAIGRLDDEAKTLFGDGRGVRRISKAAAAVKDNRRLIADRSLSGADFLRDTAAEAALSARLAGMQEEAAAMRTQHARLERTRRTAPVRGALAEAAAALAALGTPPPLPPDAADRRAAALAARDQARHDQVRDQDRLAGIEAQRAGLTPDPVILADAGAVIALEADRTRIQEIRRDHGKVGEEAAQVLRTLDATAERLGVPERGAALRARVPDAALRRTAERLLTQAAERGGARETAMLALRRAQRAAAAAALDRAQAPPPADADSPDSLRDTIEAANREGALDADLAEAAARLALTRQAAAAALANLPLWSGDLARLQAAPVPLEAEAARLAAALDKAAAARDAADEALLQNGQQQDACRAALAGLERAGPLPTPEAIAALRSSRDAAWRQLRQALAEGAAPPPGLPERLTGLLAEADALADSRNDQAERVIRWERTLNDQASLHEAATQLHARQHAAAARLHAAQQDWAAAWQPACVQPLAPAAMRDWVRLREGVLQAAEQQREAASRHDQLAARHAAILARLQAALPATPGDLATLRHAATRRLHAIEAAAARHAAAAITGRQADIGLAEATDTLAGLDQQAAEWRRAWAPVARRLGLPVSGQPVSGRPVSGQPDADQDGDTSVEAGGTLALWAEVAALLDTWTALDGRLQDMRRTLAAHDAELDALAARLGVMAGPGLVPDLAARLQAAQHVRAEQTRLQAEHAALAAAIARHGEQAGLAAAALEALRRQAGADDEAGLAAALQRVAEHRHWTLQQETRRAELHRLNDGRSDAELAAEAAEIDSDAIPGRLAEIEGRLTVLDTEGHEAAARRADLRRDLARMAEGQDVTGPAQDIQDSLTDIEESAHRYVRLRLAHALLQGGLDRFRRSQQGPLLARASTLFAELTGGRYDRLEQDEGERGETVIVAVRQDGSLCPAEMLSEGTRDQLFLALRLASIALDAAVAEPLPFIADDLLVNFDDTRARAALRLLARFGAVTQVILFTHHDHLVPLLDPGATSLHRLPAALAT